MFAVRQIWKYACTSVQRPRLTNNIPYFGSAKYPVVLNSFNFASNSLFSTNVGIPNIRLGLLAMNTQNQINQNRSVTQYSISKGKRRIVHAVLKKFYRLDWGIWIRTKCGRHRKMHKKSSARKRRLQQHVFCNAQQSNLLDKMVSKFYRRPKYFVDDPYEPYHKREEFVFTRKKPLNNEIL